MKVKEVARLIPDQLILYKQDPDSMDYVNLYKGYASCIPGGVAEMEVRTIGAAKKGIVDIQVN